jgi:hypothetical protein
MVQIPPTPLPFFSLPEHLSFDCVKEFTEFVGEHSDKEIYLDCTGDGGLLSECMAVASLIKTHGNVTGILVGQAKSSHVTVFAHCHNRLIYPYSSIALHPTKIFIEGDGSQGIDVNTAYCMYQDLKACDDFNLDSLVAASNKGRTWWENRYYKTVSYLNTINAPELIHIGFAKYCTKNFARAS